MCLPFVFISCLSTESLCVSLPLLDDSASLYFSSTTLPLFLDLSSTMNHSKSLSVDSSSLPLSSTTLHLFSFPRWLRLCFLICPRRWITRVSLGGSPQRWRTSISHSTAHLDEESLHLSLGRSLRRRKAVTSLLVALFDEIKTTTVDARSNQKVKLCIFLFMFESFNSCMS